MIIHDLQEQEDRLNSEYWHYLENIKADIVCEDDYIILELVDRPRFYFKNEEQLKEFLDFQRLVKLKHSDYELYKQVLDFNQ